MTLRAVRVPPALAGALVALLLAEGAVRVLLAGGLLPHEPGWINDEYPAKVAAMEDLAADGGASTVILGSSVADTGIDPARLSDAAAGPRGAYNAALLGPTPTTVERWSAGWVEPLLAPEVVVFVVSSRDLNANAPHLPEHEQRFAEGRWVRHRLGTESPWQRVERWVTQQSALLRYRTVLHRPVASILRASPPPLTEDGMDTHLLDEGYRIELFLDNLLAPGSTANAWEDFELDRARMAAMTALAERLADAGTRVVLVDTPVTVDYPPLHPDGVRDYLAYRDALAGLAADTGSELVVAGFFPPEQQADPLHVNGDGATRLTALVDSVLTAEPTTDGGRVDLESVPGASEHAGPADPRDPDVPGPRTIPPEGPEALTRHGPGEP